MRLTRALIGISTLAAISNCSTSEPQNAGGLAVAVSSDLSIPKDIDKVVLEVVNGGDKQSFVYPLLPAAGGKPMPMILEVLPASAAGRNVLLRLIGEHDGGADGPTARVVREATLTVPSDRVGLVDMPLRWLCDGHIAKTADGSFTSDCPEGETCVAGQCGLSKVTLEVYNPGNSLGGEDHSCMNVTKCFASAHAVTPDADCTLPLPPAADAKRLNVAMASTDGDGHCGGNSSSLCLVPLDHDEKEGWSVRNGRVALPRAICYRLASGKIQKLVLSDACAAKTKLEPLCGPWTTVSLEDTVQSAGAPGVDTQMPTAGAGGADGAGAEGGSGGGTANAGGGAAPGGGGTAPGGGASFGGGGAGGEDLGGETAMGAGGTPGGTRPTGGTVGSGGSATGGSATGGNATGGSAAGGKVGVGGNAAGGNATGGNATGGNAGAGGSGTGGTAPTGTYAAGDFDNHTTCADGSTSMAKLVKKATDVVETPWGLDWFVQAEHGGNGNRNCLLVEDATLSTPAYPLVAGVGPNTTWEGSSITPKGDASGTSPNRNMWQWQSIQEFKYPFIEYLDAYKNLPLFLGVEAIVPGHEHGAVSIVTGQMPTALDTAVLPTTQGYTALGAAAALAEWEYCFDRANTDTSRGTTNAWDCSVPGSLNATDPSWNATANKLVPAGGTGSGIRGHQKALESVKWMAAFHPETSYFVPAHLERAGQFNPDGNNGFNVEHLRDFNSAAPKIAFGMETQPGHGASSNRGEYQLLRNNIGGVQTDSAGGTTYGGTGVYGAQIGGVWDALLGEGRNFWFFASSDFKNRGSFGVDDRRSTQDFLPGEYQRNYTMVQNRSDKVRPQMIVDGLRSGNTFTANGQLIDRLAFAACIGDPGAKGRSDAAAADIATNAAMHNTTPSIDGCATMGEKLVVAPGRDIVVAIAVRDPVGANFSPYTFANPSLLQIGVTQPLNAPVLDHIDLIRGLVSGYGTPGTSGYSGEWPRNTNWLRSDGTTADLSTVPDAAKNTSATILRTFNGNGATPWNATTSLLDDTRFLTMTFRIPAVTASQYIRLRGTNLPPAVPFETDGSGNPLSDLFTNAFDTTALRIPCTAVHSAGSQFDGCPDHLAVATGSSPIADQKALSLDVAAWADLWFYSNPIYIEVTGSTVVAGVQ